MYLIHVGYIGNRQHDWNTTKGLVYGLRSSSNAFWNAVVAESLSRPDNKGTKSFEDYQLECQGRSSCYDFRIETQKLLRLRFVMIAIILMLRSPLTSWPSARARTCCTSRYWC